MTDAPKIDTQAPDYKGFTEAIMEEWQYHCDIDAATKFDLAVKHHIIREIPGGYNRGRHEDTVGVCPNEGDPWYEMNDAPDLSAAREAAAAMAMRERCADMVEREGHSLHVAIRHAPLPDPAALDRLIAERVREAVEAERARIADEITQRRMMLHQQLEVLDISREDAVYKICAEVARGSKEGQL